MVSLAMATASPSSRAGMTLSTGPKISSRAMVEEFSTLEKTVGSTNQPFSRCAGRPPPVASVAPSATPLSMYPSTRSRCRLTASGPICDSGSNWFPTLTCENASTSASVSSS